MASHSFPILIIAPPTLRETVLFSGLVKRLVDEMPQARFTIVGSAEAAEVFGDLPGLDTGVVIEGAPSGLAWLRLWLRLRRRRWGLVLDMRGLRLSRSLKARRRAIRRPLSPALEPVHKVVEGALILRIDDDPPAPFVYTSPETEAAARALVGAGGGPILALAPGADWVGKTWPAERFAMVAAELLAPRGPLSGGRLMVVGRQEDRWAAEPVRRAIARDRLIDLAGRADIATTFACLRHARIFIGGDCDMTHLAAAAGAPTLGLFGPSDERIWGPWGSDCEALRGPRDLEAIKTADPGLNQAVCHMQDLPVAWVVNAARRLLDATQGRTAPEQESADA